LSLSKTLGRVLALVSQKEVLMSSDGYDELAEDDILVRDILAGLTAAIVVDDYPDYAKGPCVLVLQRDAKGNPIHVVWGIPKGHLLRRWSSPLTDRTRIVGRTTF